MTERIEEFIAKAQLPVRVVNSPDRGRYLEGCKEKVKRGILEKEKENKTSISGLCKLSIA